MVLTAMVLAAMGMTTPLSMLDGNPLQTVGAGGMFLFLSVGAICLFTFISIAVWTEARRKERQAYYKAETMRRLTEASGTAGAQAVIEVMREEERIQQARAVASEAKQLEGMKIGGVVNIGIGIALYAFMRNVGGPAMVGAFPFAVGIALTLYAYVLAAKSAQR